MAFCMLPGVHNYALLMLHTVCVVGNTSRVIYLMVWWFVENLLILSRHQYF